MNIAEYQGYLLIDGNGDGVFDLNDSQDFIRDKLTGQVLTSSQVLAQNSEFPDRFYFLDTNNLWVGKKYSQNLNGSPLGYVATPPTAQASVNVNHGLRAAGLAAIAGVVVFIGFEIFTDPDDEDVEVTPDLHVVPEYQYFTIMASGGEIEEGEIEEAADLLERIAEELDGSDFNEERARAAYDDLLKALEVISTISSGDGGSALEFGDIPTHLDNILSHLRTLLLAAGITEINHNDLEDLAWEDADEAIRELIAAVRAFILKFCNRQIELLEIRLDDPKTTEPAPSLGYVAVDLLLDELDKLDFADRDGIEEVRLRVVEYEQRLESKRRVLSDDDSVLVIESEILEEVELRELQECLERALDMTLSEMMLRVTQTTQDFVKAREIQRIVEESIASGKGEYSLTEKEYLEALVRFYDGVSKDDDLVEIYGGPVELYSEIAKTDMRLGKIENAIENYRVALSWALKDQDYVRAASIKREQCEIYGEGVLADAGQDHLYELLLYYNLSGQVTEAFAVRALLPQFDHQALMKSLVDRLTTMRNRLVSMGEYVDTAVLVDQLPIIYYMFAEIQRAQPHALQERETQIRELLQEIHRIIIPDESPSDDLDELFVALIQSQGDRLAFVQLIHMDK